MAVQIVSADDNVRQLYTQHCAEGRCGECQHLDICGGNTRVRAWSLTGDPWQEDPACYLTDEEIGASGEHERLQVTPYHRTIRIKQA